MSSDNDTPDGAFGALRRLLETAVYIPVGAVTLLQEQMPQLRDRGRNQIAMAKMVGQFAAQQGRVELEKRAKAQRDDLEGRLRGLFGLTADEANDQATGDLHAATDRAGDPGGATPTSDAVAAAVDESAGTKATPMVPPAEVAKIASRANTKPARKRSAPGRTQLAIDNYDSLAATNILSLIDGLRPDDLKAIAAYEASHRARRTVLHRIEALLNK